MTTNKPEVFEVYRTKQGTLENVVLLADYEALQAECDRLNSYYKNGIDCFANPCEMHSGERTPPFSEFFERYGGRCLICVVDNNKALQAENEKLRKDAERYRHIKKGRQWIVAAKTGAQVGGVDLDDLIDSEMEQQK